MSFAIQTPVSSTVTEVSFFAAEAEESSVESDFEMPSSEMQGGLKTSFKEHIVTSMPKCLNDSKTEKYVLSFGPKIYASLPSTTKHLLPLATLYRPLQDSVKRDSTPLTPQRTPPKEPRHLSNETQGAPQKKSESYSKGAAETQAKRHLEEGKETLKTSTSRQEKTEQKKESAAWFVSRQWSKEETNKWWEERYSQKERQKENQKQDQEQQEQKEEKSPLCISKSTSLSSKNAASPATSENDVKKMKKPELTAPRLGIFALYYILTKMGIFSDGISNFAYKKELEALDAEATEVHKKRLEEVNNALKKEKETERWGVMVKMFSWMTSCVGIISGIALVATGVGAFAGAMLIIGGAIQITNQMMEMMGGWQKIAEILPGEDLDKKRAVVSWMQIGIAVLCLVLSGVGVIWGGFSNFSEATQVAMGVFTGIVAMGYGATTIAEGMTAFMFKNRLATVKTFDIQLAKLKHLRQDLMDKVDLGVDRLEKLFEDLSSALEFEEELFQADQMLLRK